MRTGVSKPQQVLAPLAWAIVPLWHSALPRQDMGVKWDLHEQEDWTSGFWMEPLLLPLGSLMDLGVPESGDLGSGLGAVICQSYRRDL